MATAATIAQQSLAEPTRPAPVAGQQAAKEEEEYASLFQKVMGRPNENTESKLIIFVGDYEYDITQWKFDHPGGMAVLQQYHYKDATDVFAAFHDEKTYKMLEVIPRKPRVRNHQPIVNPENPAETFEQLSPESEALLKDWRETREKAIKLGVLDRKYFYYVWSTLIDLAWFAAAMYFLFQGNWLISALFLAVFYQQLLFLGHDLGHHAVFWNRTYNYNAGLLVTAFVGWGFVWWKNRHNPHHAITNVLETDPDAINLPVFCWDDRELEKIPTTPGASTLIPYQHIYFWPFLPFLRLYWSLDTLVFTYNLLHDKNRPMKKKFKPEAIAIFIYFLWATALPLYFCPTWFAFFTYVVLSNCLGSAIFAIIVFANHDASPLVSASDRTSVNWVDMQVRGTRNYNDSWWETMFSGGLNYQIEHHLFPNIPRPNYPLASKIIKEFCAKHNLPYDSVNFITAVKLVNEKLIEMAAKAKVVVEKQKNK